MLVETKFSKILVGVDGSKESMDAANYAIGLAKKDNAKLVSFTVMQHLPTAGQQLNPQKNGKKRREQK